MNLNQGGSGLVHDAAEIVNLLDKEAKRLEGKLMKIRGQNHQVPHNKGADGGTVPSPLIMDSQIFDENEIRFNNELVDAIKNKLRMLDKLQ